MPGPFDYTVAWGDGETDENVNESITHTYEQAGSYDVAVRGQFPHMAYPDDALDGDARKIIEVRQWGSIQWGSMDGMFQNAANAVFSASDIPDLSQVTSMHRAFRGVMSYPENLPDWDISSVRDMSSVFQESGLSTEEYSALLIAWASRETPPGSVTVGAGDIQFTGDAAHARRMLIEDYGWTITDGGEHGATENLDEVDDTEGIADSEEDDGTEDSESEEGADDATRPDSTTDSDGSVGSGDPTSSEDSTGSGDSTSSEDSTGGGGSTGSAPPVDTEVVEDATDPDPDPEDTSEEAINTDSDTAESFPADAFVFRVKTDNAGFDYTVAWGDGETDENVNESITHTYEQAGSYDVEVRGQFPHMSYPLQVGNGDATKIVDVKQWGSIQWASMDGMFQNATNAVFSAADVPDVSQVTSMHRAFRGVMSYPENLTDWDISSVTDMSIMFAGGGTVPASVGTWDTSNVINMSSMFSNVEGIDADLTGWNVSNVTDMNSMFMNVTEFNQDISGWDVSSLENTSQMFYNASAFNQNIGEWDMSSATNIGSMFMKATSFNQDIGKWDISGVTNLFQLFFGAEAFNQDISGWDVSNVTVMMSVFANAASFDQDLTAWDVSNVTTMMQVFLGATNFNGDISNWDVSSVESFTYAFRNAESFNGDISGWDVGAATNMRMMFDGAVAFNRDISGWDVSNVTSMHRMFKDAAAFDQNLMDWNVNSWGTAGTQGGYEMFDGSGLSTANYSNTLIGWAGQEEMVPRDVGLSAVGTKYTAAAATAREALIDDFGWIISDDGVQE